MSENALRDKNRIPVALGVSNADATVPLPFLIDSVTGRVLVDSSTNTGQVLTPTGTVNGSNNVFTVPAGTVITSVVIDGLERYSGFGYTYSDPTITVDPLNPPTEYIRVNTSSVTAVGRVNTVVAGTNVTVDSTDPANPIVSATSGQYKIFVTVGTANADYLISNYADVGAAINAAYLGLASTGGIIFVDDGNFSYSTPIVLNTAEKFVLLQGAPGGATTLTYTGGGTTVALTYNVSKAITTGHGIRNLKLVGPSSSGTTAGILIGGLGADDSKGFAGGTLRDVHVRGFGCNWVIGNNAFIVTYDNCVSNFGGKLLYAKGSAGAGATAWNVAGANTINSGENMKFLGCTFADANNAVGGSSTADYAVEINISGITDFQFVDCSFDDAQLYQNQFTGGVSTNNIHLTNCHFENPAANSISAYYFIDSIANQVGDQMYLTNCQFAQQASTSAPAAFIRTGSILTMDGVTFMKNFFSSASTVTRAVLLRDGTAVNSVSWWGCTNSQSAVTYITNTIPFTPSGMANGATGYMTMTNAGLLIATNMNGVLDASTFPGADINAKIQAAYDSVTTSVPCCVTITVPSGQYSAVTTNVVFGTNGKRALVIGTGGGGQGTEILWTGSGDAFTYNCGIQSSSPFISHSSGYGMIRMKITGNDQSNLTNQRGIYCGGTYGAAGIKLEDVDLFGFGTGLQTGANTYMFTWQGGVIRNCKRLVEIESANNSGEMMHFINGRFLDVAGNVGTDGFHVSDYGAASLLFTGGSMDSCQLHVGVQCGVTINGMHMENPSGSWAKYTPIIMEDSSYSSLCLTGMSFVNTANKPDNFISSAGATVNLNGVLFFNAGGGTVTTAILGGRAIWTGITNGNSAITNVISGYPYTYSGSNQTAQFGNAVIKFTPTTTSLASMNLPTGTAPSAPVDGDIWREDNTNTGLKVRINGVTKTITVS